EEGMRDSSVTGVQTCALPILWDGGDFAAWEWVVALKVDENLTKAEKLKKDKVTKDLITFRWDIWNEPNSTQFWNRSPSQFFETRSEERRVGKRGRSRQPRKSR